MSCFFSHAGRTAIPVLLSVALAAAACNKDGEITLPDSKPRITLDSETGVYAAKIGRAVTITPTVENEGEAAYSWTIDDEVVSTARVFEYVFNEEGRVYVTLRVENRAGYDEKEARIVHQHRRRGGLGDMRQKLFAENHTILSICADSGQERRSRL